MLNLKQLEYAEDSLTKEYEDQVSRFSDLHLKTNYFKKEKTLFGEFAKIADQKTKKKKSEKDVKNKKKKNNKTPKSELILSIDTITNKFSPQITLNSINKKYKEEAVQNALTYARAAQNNISNSKKQFNYKAERIRRHQIEWHRKFALSFACLVFFFIGAPFGAIVRKGGFGTPVVISILFFILYYVISISGEKFAREGIMPASIGMWLSSFILMPLGIFLTYKATTDSVILNSDTYLLFFKKFFARFFKKSDK